MGEASYCGLGVLFPGGRREKGVPLIARHASLSHSNKEVYLSREGEEISQKSGGDADAGTKKQSTAFVT